MSSLLSAENSALARLLKGIIWYPSTFNAILLDHEVFRHLETEKEASRHPETSSAFSGATAPYRRAGHPARCPCVFYIYTVRLFEGRVMLSFIKALGNDDLDAVKP